MIILIDQDGVLADFEKGFLDMWKAKFPDEFFVPLSQRKAFYVHNDYPKDLKDKVDSIYFSPEFFLNLLPVPGSIDAVKMLIELGYDVRICSSPFSQYENCILEKYMWVERYLGRDFTKRIILSKDKSIIRGEFLIDDRPTIKGEETAEWEHVVYDCPYNRRTTGKKRMLGWKNCMDVLNSH